MGASCAVARWLRHRRPPERKRRGEPLPVSLPSDEERREPEGGL